MLTSIGLIATNKYCEIKNLKPLLDTVKNSFVFH